MQTRTREHGTRDHWPKDGAERIAAFREIVSECQHAKIDGCSIDLFSASIVVQVYDNLNEQNKTKFAGCTARKMALVALKMLK